MDIAITQLQEMRDGLPGGYSAEAAELGFAPGVWPERFEVAGLGTFVRGEAHGEHGDLHWVAYEVPNTLLRVRVYND
ncbi:MAG: hypothetical protein V4510_09755 [bacterium]